MSQEIKRYDLQCNDVDGAWMEESLTGEFVVATDHDRAVAELRAENERLMSTYVALVDKLGIDTEAAKSAPGKPSDVIVAHVERLEEELAKTELRALKFAHQCNAHVELYCELRDERDAALALLRECASTFALWHATPELRLKNRIDALLASQAPGGEHVHMV